MPILIVSNYSRLYFVDWQPICFVIDRSLTFGLRISSDCARLVQLDPIHLHSDSVNAACISNSIVVECRRIITFLWYLQYKEMTIEQSEDERSLPDAIHASVLLYVYCFSRRNDFAVQRDDRHRGSSTKFRRLDLRTVRVSRWRSQRLISPRPRSAHPLRWRCAITESSSDREDPLPGHRRLTLD